MTDFTVELYDNLLQVERDQFEAMRLGRAFDLVHCRKASGLR